MAIPFQSDDALSTLPVVAFAAFMLVRMRMQGVLTDEMISDLYAPFSRTTLTVIGAIVALWQVSWILSRLVS